ncbi:MAG: prepilin-type N-terminal cleavage/methylation domain-containing protein [Candidatus Electrothrix sp. AR1]|nr:prepilin-type N-terminal cleavage/methylation domain-containing protein [Candidatus Electrothrix sp. AR1]
MKKNSVVGNEKGNTLIELMIVIAIILILGSMAIPNYIAYKNKAYCVATVNDTHAIAMGLADYFAIPANTSASTSFVTGGGGTRPYILIGNWLGGGYSANTMLLSASTTSASAVQIGGNYRISVTEGAGNCPLKLRQTDLHWSQGLPGMPVSYFMTL